jgi:hypothetical protein
MRGMKFITPLTLLWLAILCIVMAIGAFTGAAFEYCDYRGWLPKNPVTGPTHPSPYDAVMMALMGSLFTTAAVFLLRYRSRLKRRLRPATGFPVS